AVPLAGAGQTLLQLPQFFGSLLRLTQTPLQLVWPCGQPTLAGAARPREAEAARPREASAAVPRPRERRPSASRRESPCATSLARRSKSKPGSRAVLAPPAEGVAWRGTEPGGQGKRPLRGQRPPDPGSRLVSACASR